MTEHLVSPDGIARAAELLANGELVAIPTETVYGLAAVARDAVAVAKIFVAKGRPSDNPLIVHVADRDVTGIVASWPAVAVQLSNAFWPGPLTLVADRHADFPAAVSAGRSTVGVRCPSHPSARELLARTGPLAAPSANRSGRPSPTNAQHVFDDLDGRIEAVLDGGPCVDGLESTVVDVTVVPPMILRPGSITRAQLEQVVGEVSVHPSVLAPSETTDARAPGMRYRHYSPDAAVWLVEGEHAVARAARLVADEPSSHAVLVGGEPAARTTVFTDAGALGTGLYAVLRHLDAQGVERIVFAGIPFDATAVLNRVRKAASRVLP